MNVLVIVSEELVNILVKVLVDRDDHPLRVHLEKEQESQYGFAPEHDRLVLKELRNSHLESLIFLESIVELVVRLDKSDVNHG